MKMSLSERFKEKLTPDELVSIMFPGSRWIDEKGRIWMVLQWYARIEGEHLIPSRVELGAALIDNVLSVDYERMEEKIKAGHLNQFKGALQVSNSN